MDCSRKNARLRAHIDCKLNQLEQEIGESERILTVREMRQLIPTVSCHGGAGY
jgi:hypothetical protein